MSEHTCGQTPNDDGRILPQCDGCHDTAYVDGKITGRNAGIFLFAKALEAEVRGRYDPFQYAEDVSKAHNTFDDGIRFLKIIRTVKAELEAQNE